MCHGECTWADDSCVENKPLPVYKGFAIIKIIFGDDDDLFIKQILLISAFHGLMAE